MLPELTSRQVLALANGGASAEQISNAISEPIEEIKLVLAAHNAGAPADRDINDEQLALLRQRLFTLAMGSDDDSVSARTAMFLVERDKPKTISITSPIVQINQAIMGASQAFQQDVKEYSNNGDS